MRNLILTLALLCPSLVTAQDLPRSEAVRQAWALYHETDDFALRDPARFVEARNALMEATDLDPRNVEALHLLGRMFARDGHWRPAANFFRRALQWAPDNSHYGALLGLAWAHPHLIAKLRAKLAALDAAVPTDEFHRGELERDRAKVRDDIARLRAETTDTIGRLRARWPEDERVKALRVDD